MLKKQNAGPEINNLENLVELIKTDSPLKRIFYETETIMENPRQLTPYPPRP